MTVAFTGHTTDGAGANWVRSEILRVLTKLRQQNQVTDLAVAFDCGQPLIATECALLRGIPVRWHTLVDDDTLPTLRNVDGYEGRTRFLMQHPLVTTDVLPSPYGTSRARRRARNQLMADTYRTHIVVYDGRDRGSVLGHLQLVMGTHDVIHIDPTDQRTMRIPAPVGAPIEEYAHG